MSWVKLYEEFINETDAKEKDIVELEKVLGLPQNTGIFTEVFYDKKKNELVIEQPKDLNAMDAGAVLAAINKEKKKIKQKYSGIDKVIIGDLQITI